MTMTDDVIAKGLTNDTAGLGRFGRHPDPAIDFCIEVETLQSRLFDAQNGLSKPGEQPEMVAAVAEYIAKAMEFRVGGDPGAVGAKAILRELEAQAQSALAAVGPTDWKARAEKAEAELAKFADANHRQALCITFTASALGPEYSGTIDALPKAARHVREERDALRATLAEYDRTGGWMPIETAQKDGEKE